MAGEDDAEGATGRAMRVATALAKHGTEEFAKPGKLVEVRFIKGQSLSLTASRLLALMILTAGGDAWRDVTHRMRKADIRRGHKGNERIVDMLEELHRTLFAEDDTSWRGRKATRRFPLIQMSKEEVEEDGRETGWIEWSFTPDARRLIQESESYAVLNRQAVLSFRSTYALRLYEMGALRIHRRQSNWKGDMTALRAALGIGPDVYKDFAQLRRKVLQTAKAEIDQLAHFTVEWKEVRKGRAVVEIEICFIPKSAPEQILTGEELERHSIGRKARREGKIEQIVSETANIVTQEVAPEALASPMPMSGSAPAPMSVIISPSAPKSPALRLADQDLFAAFPDTSLHYASPGIFREIARAYGGGWDIDLIAGAYREHMGTRLASLSGNKLKQSWIGFCESYASRRGRP